MDERSKMRPLRPLPNLIFMSRWLQLPLYLGLILAQATKLGPLQRTPP